MKKVFLILFFSYFLIAENYCKQKDNYYVCQEGEKTYECYNYLILTINNTKYIRCYTDDDIAIDFEFNNETLNNKKEDDTYKDNKNTEYDYNVDYYEKHTKKKNNKYKCGTKKYCSQMSSCAEAYFYFNECGVKKLDRDNDGIPCEKLCK